MARRKPSYQEKEERAAAEAARDSQSTAKRIPADLTQQAPNNSYISSRLYYEDREFTCIDCGQVEVWTAKDQQWWYETAKGSIFTSARRCLTCRNALVDAHNGTPRRSHRMRREESARVRNRRR